MIKKLKLFIFFYMLNIKFSQANNFANKKVLRKGIKYQIEEQFAASQKYYSDYIKKCINKIDCIEAEYNHAFCTLVLKNTTGNKLFDKFIKKYNNQVKIANVYYQLGNFSFAENEFDTCIEYYEKINQNNLSNKRKYKLQYRLAYAYLNKKEFQQALLHFNNIKSKNHPFTYAANYYSGYILLRQKNYNKALIDLKKAAEFESYKSVVPYLICQVFYQQKKYKKLINFINETQQKDLELKNQDEIELMLADSYREIKLYDDSARHFENYIILRDNVVEEQVLFRAAFTLYKAKKLSQSINKFKILAESHSKVGQMSSYYLGKLFIEQGHKQRALSAFKKAYDFKKFSKNIQEESGLLYATLNYEIGNPYIAIQTLKDLKYKFPESKNIKKIDSLLSDLYINTNNYDLAITQLEKTKNKNKKMLLAYQKGTFYRANEHFNNQEFENAIVLFRKSFTTGIDEKMKFAASIWIGECLSAMLKYKEAIIQYKKALKNNHANKYRLYYTQGIYGLSYAYFNTKQYKESLENFKKLLSIEQDNKTTIENNLRIADCLYALSEYEKAIIYYSKSLKLDNNIPHAYLQKGIIYFIKNQFTQCSNELNKVLKNPKNINIFEYEKALFYLAQLSYKQGKYKESIALYNKFIEQNSKSKYIPKAYLNKAIAHLNIKEIQKTITLCERLLNEFPESGQAYIALLELQKIVDNTIFNKYLKQYKEANPGKKSLAKIEFELAKKYFYELKYEKCAHLLKVFLNKYPKVNQYKEAVFLLAQSLKKINNNAEAIIEYKRVLNFTTSKFYKRAILQLARLEYELEQYKESFEHFKLLNEVSKNKKDIIYSLEGIMLNAYKLEKYNDSITYSEKLLKVSNMISISLKAKLYYAKSALMLKEDTEALGYLRDIIKNSKSQIAAEAQYLIAKNLYDNKKYEKSNSELFKLNTNFSNYITWIDKSYLLIAKNYLAQEDIFQTKATLNSIIENSKDDKIINKAKNLMQKIQKPSESIVKITDVDKIKSKDKKEFYTID